MPSEATFLYAVNVPGDGGDTRFANTTLAFEALAPDRRAALERLRVIHSWERSVARHGGSITEAERTRWPPIAHPLARTHPGSGRKALFMGQHASHIEGLPLAEGQALLDELLEHSTQDAFCYSHQWRAGDLLMWDNRCLLHRAMPNFQVDASPRVLHRTVTQGDEVPR